MNTQLQTIERQNRLLQQIALDTLDIEQIIMVPGDRQQVAREKIREIRQCALAGMSDREVTNEILSGYREDCVNVLFTAKQQLDAYFSGRISLDDDQLQHMVVACEMYTVRAREYFEKKNMSGMEVDHG